jgi:hypothetical protein
MRAEYLFDVNDHISSSNFLRRPDPAGEPTKPLNDPSGLHAERTRVDDSDVGRRFWEFCGKKTVFWKLCESSVLPPQNFSGNREQIPLAIYLLQRKIASL